MPNPARRRRIAAAALAAAAVIGPAGGAAVGPASAGSATPTGGSNGPAADSMAEPTSAPGRTFTLSPPAEAAAGALWVVRLRLGPLPPGAAVTVAATDGTVLGGHAPFGAEAAAGPATVPVPLPDYRGAGPLDLRLWVELDDGTRRAPTPAEFRGAELVPVGGARP